MRSLARLMLFVLAATAAADDLTLTRLVTGLDQPTYATHAGDSRLFITLQRGRVVIYEGGSSVRSTPFLDITSLTSSGGERGLLGLAFHPRYNENGFFFVYHTISNGDIVIARYTVSATDPNRADPATRRVIITISHSAFSNHNGGQLAFGPDGFLYAGTGDGGSGGDPNNNGQNQNALLGKILRLNIDVGSTYTIPDSNPFVGRANTRGEIWAYGLRNPWRFSFDRVNGDLWIGDVGQGQWEEVDHQPVTSIGGENYGWRRMEGKHCFNPATNCQDATMTLPIAEYDHGGGRCSITGGYRYRGAKYPLLNGTYLFADYCSGTIWGLNGPSATPQVLAQTTMSIVSFGEDMNGELVLADQETGSIYSISQPGGTPLRRRAARH